MLQKIVCRVSFVALLLVPGVVWGEAEVIDGIAAVVNGDVITFSQVQEVAAPEEQSLKQQFTGQELIDKIKETRLAVLNDLVNRQLILQEFKKKEYQLPDYVVEEQVQEIIKDEFGGDRQAFQVARQGRAVERHADERALPFEAHGFEQRREIGPGREEIEEHAAARARNCRREQNAGGFNG